MKTNNESRDNVAAIGIGAMIVFIALILVAAVAAAVIIQTAEKLQQNAQTAGDDTADNMAGKLFIDTAFVDTNDAANDYMLFVKLAPGSEITNINQVTFQMFCENGRGRAPLHCLVRWGIFQKHFPLLESQETGNNGCHYADYPIRVAGNSRRSTPGLQTKDSPPPGLPCLAPLR